MAGGSTGTLAAGRDQHIDAPGLQLFVFALFFIFGGITSLNDVIIPKLKELFTLSYTQAMLIQFCFFTAYLVIGLPGAQLVKRTGYLRGAVVGLVTMMIGCLLFIPASRGGTYGLFLFALFILATGVVVVQIVANPLITLLGPGDTASSRLTFAQAFNSVGTTIFPFIGSILILSPLAAKTGTSVQPFWDVTRVTDPACNGGEGVAAAVPATTAYRIAETQVVAHAYIGLAVALAVIAAVVWALRNLLRGERHAVTSLAANLQLLRRPRFAFGAACIFLYVGAEVAIGSTIVNHLKSSHMLCLTDQSAGKQLLFYWGGAMVGRFVGSAVLRRFSPGRVLAGVAIGALVLLAAAFAGTGATAADALLAVGLMNAIMFPTIFSLACEGLGARAADGSGIINVAIFGGAVIPLLTGGLADLTSLSTSLIVPALCYLLIALYGRYCAQERAGVDAA
jgi:FHS family L-fucose permease-like MFS transporter